MGQALQLLVTLTEINCGECGGTYAINERYRRQRQDNSGTWNCPYCQTSWGYAKGELQQEQERHRATLARLNKAVLERDQLGRKLERVQRGVCPHCNRMFQNLARHMKCKHGE